jgi:hypothetical protein
VGYVMLVVSLQGVQPLHLVQHAFQDIHVETAMLGDSPLAARNKRNAPVYTVEAVGRLVNAQPAVSRQEVQPRQIA